MKVSFHLYQVVIFSPDQMKAFGTLRIVGVNLLV